MVLLDEGETTCCYARSEKHWVTDPQGIAWEHFHTLGNIPVFNEASTPVDAQSACCAPAATATAAAPTVAPAACCTPTTRGKRVGIAIKSSSSCC
jgi:hypothetical protein